MTATKYNMGPKRSYRTPAPSKIRFTEHNGRMVCANPSGVPAKWLPVYLELASRLIDDGPSFAIGKDENEPGQPITLRLKDECGSWSTYGDPTDAMRSLEMSIAPVAKAKPAPKPTKPVVNPADEMVTELVEHFGKSPAEAHELIDEICVEESWPRPIAPPLQGPSSPTTQELPEWAEEWLAGLVYELKREYARQYLEHILCNGPAPVDPSTEWAHKARKRADRLAELAA